MGPRETDRVRKHSAAAVLARIDSDTFDALLQHTGEGVGSIPDRLARLDREWDTDRTLEVEASIMALTGLALGAGVNRRFFAVPGVVASMVLLQAFTGWYPLYPLFRRLGIRTAREISRERYALKALRGDFNHMDAQPGGQGTEQGSGEIDREFKRCTDVDSVAGQ